MEYLIFKYVLLATFLVWLSSCSKTSRDEPINKYKMEITKKEYDFFILSSEEYRPHKGIEELGDFHITNDDKILFSGKKYWSKNRFFLFNEVEEIVNYDLELSIYFPSRSRKVDEKLVDEINTRFIPSIKNNKIVNLNDALGIISKLLDLDEESLDFSVLSLKNIDNRTLSSPNEYRYYLLVPLICYLSEMIKKKYEGVSLIVKDDGGNYYLSKGDDDFSNIGVITSDYFLQADFCPNVTMVYTTVVRELNLKL